ncbi:hypothetical protein GOV05_05560 [Candidatus Woesearchaeota archaeon]|nr:hypothetical protein [Candidatus Woesearchaeota archaeon]
MDIRLKKKEINELSEEELEDKIEKDVKKVVSPGKKQFFIFISRILTFISIFIFWLFLVVMIEHLVVRWILIIAGIPMLPWLLYEHVLSKKPKKHKTKIDEDLHEHEKLNS